MIVNKHQPWIGAWPHLIAGIQGTLKEINTWAFFLANTVYVFSVQFMHQATENVFEAVQSRVYLSQYVHAWTVPLSYTEWNCPFLISGILVYMYIFTKRWRWSICYMDCVQLRSYTVYVEYFALLLICRCVRTVKLKTSTILCICTRLMFNNHN